jgi:hypothetical protein
MPTRDAVKMIRYMLGINRRDGGDLVRDNQFYTLQNWYAKTKGLLYKREGSTADLSAASFYGASKVDGIWRHYNQGGEKFSLLNCIPDGTYISQPTTDLILQETGVGNLFDGGAVVPLRVCYTWAGIGEESSPNTISRAGYTAATRDAWNDVAHQSITLSTNAKALSVQVPVFPTGVRGVHVFVARGTSTQMTYMGTVTTSNGFLLIKHWIGPKAAATDAISGTVTANAVYFPTGTLPTGQYYIGLAWLVDSGDREDNSSGNYVFTKIGYTTAVNVTNSNRQISVSYNGAASTNGAKNLAVFIGRKDAVEHNMMFAGFITNGGGGGGISISALPNSLNRQTAASNDRSGAAATEAFFMLHPVFNGGVARQYTSGFVLRKEDNGTVSEVFMSITERYPVQGAGTNDYKSFGIVTSQNMAGGVALNLEGDFLGTYSEPSYTDLLGLSYFTNGINYPIQTDGYTMGSMVPKFGTILPPSGRFISTFKDSLVIGGGQCGSQVYFTVASTARQWTSSGTSLQFVTIGDPFGDSVTAVGMFSYTTGTEGPKTFFLAFKKNGVWGTSSLTAGSPLDQLSGKVGCAGYRTVCQSRIGTVFLGSDGVLYVVRGSGEPYPIGLAAQPILAHLVNDDTLAQKATAVVHDGFYKIAYPSASTSTYNDAQLWLDCRVDEGSGTAWYGPHTGVNIGAQIVQSGEGDNNYRFGVLSSSLGTARLDDPSTYQDLGVDIVSVMEWKTSRFGAEMHRKRFSGMVFDLYFDAAFTHAIMVEGFADDQYTQQNKSLSTGGGVWDASAFDSGLWGDALYAAIPTMFGPDNLSGRTFKWKLTHGNNAQMIMAAAGILYQPERRQIV